MPETTWAPPAFATLFEHMADAVYLLDPDTSNIVWGNRAAWESLGLSASEVLNHSVLSLQMDVTGAPQWQDIAAVIRNADLHLRRPPPACGGARGGGGGQHHALHRPGARLLPVGGARHLAPHGAGGRPEEAREPALVRAERGHGRPVGLGRHQRLGVLQPAAQDACWATAPTRWPVAGHLEPEHPPRRRRPGAGRHQRTPGRRRARATRPSTGCATATALPVGARPRPRLRTRHHRRAHAGGGHGAGHHPPQARRRPSWRATATTWKSWSRSAPPRCRSPRRRPKPPTAPRAASWPT
jgi:hypothetical protein